MAEFCDLRCAYAEPAREDMDGSRSCMTFTAIYCTCKGTHVMKAQVCEDRVERSADPGPVPECT